VNDIKLCRQWLMGRRESDPFAPPDWDMCPLCGSHQIKKSSSVNVELPDAYQECQCNGCGAEFVIWFLVSAVRINRDSNGKARDIYEARDV
jgi:hypothetical protein